MVRISVDRLTRARSRHGPALARQPSCLVNILESRRHAARSASSDMRQAACRVGFGAWALAVQLRLKPLGGQAIRGFRNGTSLYVPREAVTFVSYCAAMKLREYRV